MGFRVPCGQWRAKFPISRDPPEGGTGKLEPKDLYQWASERFQFLGIPPKGELLEAASATQPGSGSSSFQFLGIPPKGELEAVITAKAKDSSFQFLGIPPKGEHLCANAEDNAKGGSFQFLGIPPKGELAHG